MITNVSAIKSGKLSSVLPMIAKKARATFAKLPTSEKMGTSVEDLIAEGKIVAVTQAAKKWNPNKKAKFSTYLFACLDNYYTDRIRAAYTNQRYGQVYSADSTVVNRKDGSQITLIDLLKRRGDRRDEIEDAYILRIDAERGFLRVYALASPLLRKYLIRWILQPNNNKMQSGIKADAALAEFARLKMALHLSSAMCKMLQTDWRCRAQICAQIQERFVTPYEGWDVALNFVGSVERELTPLLSPAKQKSLAIFAQNLPAKISQCVGGRQ